MRILDVVRAALRRSRQPLCAQRPAPGWPERRVLRCGLLRGHDGLCVYYREEDW